MNIVLAADNNYAPLLGIAMFSILKNNNNTQINFYILDMDISEKNKNLILKYEEEYNCNINFVNTKEIHEYIKNTVKSKVRSLSTFYRIFLPTLLPTHVNKVIYMDCDSLITASLKDLWEINMDGYDIAGVIDILDDENKILIGLKKDDYYFNAGMLLINLKKWRDENKEKAMIDFINKYKGKVRYHDQGIINGVCVAKKILHPKYNVLTPFLVLSKQQILHYHKLTDYYYSQKEIEEAKKHPVFCHFTPYLTDRPWVKGNKHPLKKLYYKYADKTPWKNIQFNNPSQTLESWVKWLFYLLPYPIFIFILRKLQAFKPKTWLKKFFK